ncbi:hypothetical protein Ancab_015223 [Ancistrocladus abbreviatus]
MRKVKEKQSWSTWWKSSLQIFQWGQEQQLGSMWSGAGGSPTQKQLASMQCESDVVVSVDKSGLAHTQMVPNSPFVGGDTNRGRVKKAHYSRTLHMGRLSWAEGLLEAQASQRNLLTRDDKEKTGKQLRPARSKTKWKGKMGRRSGTRHPSKQGESHPVNASIGDSSIQNRNRVILENLNPMSVEEVWDMGKQLGFSYAGCEKEILECLNEIEAQDRVL